MKNEWDNKEVILISSLLLLTSSLDVSHLRAPLYCLDTDIQLNIQAFIQRLLTIPKKSITREIITEAIESIPTGKLLETISLNFYIHAHISHPNFCHHLKLKIEKMLTVMNLQVSSLLLILRLQQLLL